MLFVGSSWPVWGIGMAVCSARTTGRVKMVYAACVMRLGIALVLMCPAVVTGIIFVDKYHLSGPAR